MDIKVIGIDMVNAKLPLMFVLRVIELANESEGVEDLLHLWAEASNADERGEVEADLYEAIEDRELAEATLKLGSVEAVSRLFAERQALKKHLRRVVEASGGVSEVARWAGMPQPALSRILNSMSELRPATMHRLAKAMNVPTEALNPVNDAKDSGS